MKVSTFGYSVNQGVKNIKRNKLFSLASVGTIAACIFLMGLFYAIIVNFRHMVKEAENSVCVTVFFNEGTTEEQINTIADTVRKRAEVSSVSYTSAETAWENFKDDYFKDYPDAAEGFKDDNPLANSAYIEIYLNDLSMQDTLVASLKSMDGVRKVNDSPVTARTLSDFAKMVGYISLAIIIVLLAVGIFLISNTVMIGITVRKEEIKIMKLIGATDIFVRFPFIVEGVTIGIIGAAIPVGALMIIYQNIIGYLMNQFQTVTTKMAFVSSNEIFSVMIPVALLIGGGIGFAGSMITIRKHLRV